MKILSELVERGEEMRLEEERKGVEMELEDGLKRDVEEERE